MYNANFSWRNSIYTRLVIIFLLMIIPLYILGIQIVSLSRSMLREEILKSMQSKVEFNLNNLEEEIKRIKKLQYDSYVDEDLNSLANTTQIMSDYERSRAILRFQQRLTTIRDSSKLIKNVSVHIQSINLAINALGTEKGSIDEINEEVYEMFKKVPSNSYSRIILWNNRLVMEAAFPLTYSSIEDQNIFIEVELSINDLTDLLTKLDINSEESSLFEIPSQEFIISSDKNNNISNNISGILAESLDKGITKSIKVEIEGTQYFLIYAYSEYLDATISRYIPEEVVYMPLKKYLIWFWVLTFFVLLVIVLYSSSIYNFIQKPILELVNSFKKVQNGNIDFKIQYQKKDEFRYLYTSFNEMIENISILIEQVYKQTILAQKAELKQLQSQINPHFFYNSFFILQRRISKGDIKNAEKLCESLGTYFKFITHSASDEIDLAKEVEHARIYTEIQSVRFLNRIKVQFEALPDEYKNIMVPRLIIQPIIENAFEHGLEEKEEEGMLWVCFRRCNNILIIDIEDNGKGMLEANLHKLRGLLNSKREDTENTAIINIHKRLSLAMGNLSGISIMNGVYGGLKVEIKIEFKESENIV